MNVYDFDGTIYKGDSSIDFAIYCMMHNKRCRRAFPKMIKGLFLWIIGQTNTKQFKESFFSFLNYIPIYELDYLIIKFWKQKSYKIADWYKERHEANDVIISASPQFLLEPVKDLLGIKCVLGTKMAKDTGVVLGENCKGKEKVIRFRNSFPNGIIENFYSDSLSDKYLSQIANNSYYIRNRKIEKWPALYGGENKTNNVLKYKELMLYGIFGALTTIINLMIYELCYVIVGVANVQATVIAWIFAVIFAFITNKLCVFKSRSVERATISYEIITFFGARIFTGIIDIGIMWLSVDVFGLNSATWKLISNVVVIILNYVISKLVVFK